MKLLSLITWQFSQKLKREIIMCLQIFLMVLLLNVFFSIFQAHFELNKETKNTTEESWVMATVSSEFLDKYSLINEIQQCIDYVPFGQFYIGFGNINDVDNVIIILYDDTFIEHYSPNVDVGHRLAANNKNIEVLINNSLSSKYEIDEYIEIDILANGYNQNYGLVSAQVAGYLSKNEMFIYGNGYRSEFTGTNGVLTSGKTLLHQYDSEIDGIIIMSASLLGEACPTNTLDYSGIFFSDTNNVASIEQTLYDKFYGYADIRTLKDIIIDSNESIFETFGWYVIAFITLTITTAASLICYTAIMCEETKKSLGVYYICGMTWNKSVYIIFLPCLLLAIVPSIIAVLLTPTAMMLIFHINYSFTSIGILSTICFSVLTLLISSLALSYKMLKTSPLILIR